MSESPSFKLAANHWVIKARWFYILAVALVCLLLHFDGFVFGASGLKAVIASPLFSVFLLALAFNLLMFVVARMIDLETAHKHIPWLSFLQIVGEIALITMLLYDLKGGEAFVPLLYFVPIVESIILFGHYGPLLVAILIGTILNVYLYLGNFAIFRLFLDQTAGRSEDLARGAIFTWALIISLVYLVIGALSSYIARQITEREKMLESQTADQAVKLNALKNFNRELEREDRFLKAKEFELEMANKQLLSLDDAKAKFVAVTAHQLRTPLSAIKWTFDMMTSGQLGPVTGEQKDFLQKGFDSTQRMIRIVNDLLHIDQMETDKIAYQFSAVDLVTLLENVKFEFANQAVSKKIKLELVLPAQRPPQIEADENKLRVVIENLLDNAIKYTKPGGQVTVSLSDQKLNSAGGMVEIDIADTGIGIPAEDKSRIFGKFFRAGNAIREEPDGSGIGLYMSKDIIEKHSGSIAYETRAGGGTIFHLTLPLRQKKL